MGEAGGKVVGVLHPGEMGAAVAAVLRARGSHVLWSSAGRSEASAERAGRAGLEDAGSADEVARRADVILSVCPPHAALDVARSVAGFTGIYVDANAVSPGTAGEVAQVIGAGGARFVDGGIVGPPPTVESPTRLYLSGAEAGSVAALFATTPVDARVLSDQVGDASAVKMAFAGWTKGTAALLLAIRAVARCHGIEEALLAEWQESIPGLREESHLAARSAGKKGWRWVGEMEEIGSTFASAGLPSGFHEAAAEVFRRIPRRDDLDANEAALDRVLDNLVAEVETRA